MLHLIESQLNELGPFDSPQTFIKGRYTLRRLSANRCVSVHVCLFNPPSCTIWCVHACVRVCPAQAQCEFPPQLTPKFSPSFSPLLQSRVDYFNIPLIGECQRVKTRKEREKETEEEAQKSSNCSTTAWLPP